MTTRLSLPDHYEIEDQIGQGRLSTVLRARDLRTSHAVAVKALKPVAWLAGKEAKVRCRRSEESLRPLTSLRHPNLAAVHAVHACGDTFFMVRDLAHGTSLRALLRQRGTLSLYEARWLTSQIADGIDALGSAGLPHGALTPDNVFVEENGLVRVTDAGFTRAVGTLSVAGVSCQIAVPATPADDIRALAALTFKMLTGSWPLRGDGRVSSAYGLPPAVRETLRQALEGGRSPFQTATAFADALAPETRPTLFRLVWQPAAAVGLLGALVTVGGHAVSEEPGRKAIPPAPTVAQTAAALAEQAPGGKETEAPRRLAEDPLSTFSQEDRQALQLAIRRQGAAALAHPVAADLFQLTAAQRHEIVHCLAEQRARVEELVRAAADGEAADTGTVMQTLRESTSVRILTILTDAQRAQWEALTQAPLAPGQPVL